jgi:hypothetical protein
VSSARHTFVLALVLVACKDKAPAPTAAPAPTPALAPTSTDAAAPALAGKAFDGPTFIISSTLSGPETKHKEVDTAAGKTTMTMYTFTDPADDNTAQMVEINAVPSTPVSDGKLRYSAMEGMIRDLEATVDHQEGVTVGDIDMLDFTAHVADSFFVRGRVAIKAGTLYQVVAFGSGRTPTPAAELFVTSFVLK